MRASRRCAAVQRSIEARHDRGDALDPASLEHLDRCVACGRFSETLEVLGRRLRQAMDAELASLPEAVSAPELAEVPRQLRHPRGVWALAAAALVLVLAGGGFLAGSARISRLALERGTRELIDRVFRARLLEGVELAVAPEIPESGLTLGYDRDGELFIRSSWRDTPGSGL